MTTKSIEQLQRELAKAQELLAALNQDRETVRSQKERLLIDREIEQWSSEIAQLEASIRQRESRTQRRNQPDTMFRQFQWEPESPAVAEVADLALTLTKPANSWQLAVANRSDVPMSRVNVAFLETRYLKVRAGHGINKTELPEIAVLAAGQSVVCSLDDITFHKPSDEDLPHMRVIELCDAMEQCFSLQDLQGIVFSIQDGERIDWENLVGASKNAKIISLLDFWRMRRRSYARLLDACAARNAGGPWADIRQFVRSTYPVSCDASYLVDGRTRRCKCEFQLNVMRR